MATKTLSIVIPVYNEEDNIQQLLFSVDEHVQKMSRQYEIIAIDDGSTDTTYDKLSALLECIPLTVIRLARNYGQTAALMAGFNHASGEIIIQLDGDGQNDPSDIPGFIEKLEQGYDFVIGWRKERKDSRFKRNFLSPSS